MGPTSRLGTTNFGRRARRRKVGAQILYDTMTNFTKTASERPCRGISSCPPRPASRECVRDAVLHVFTYCGIDSEETAQAYSSFTTRYRPSDKYESLLIKASKIRGQAAKAFQRREAWETSLVRVVGLSPRAPMLTPTQTQSDSPETYAMYISSERRGKTPSYSILSTLYERAIADAAKRRFSAEPGAEETLRAFWAGYCDTAVSRLRPSRIVSYLFAAHFGSGNLSGAGSFAESCAQCSGFR
jgi:hypothetical protein